MTPLRQHTYAQPTEGLLDAVIDATEHRLDDGGDDDGPPEEIIIFEIVWGDDDEPEPEPEPEPETPKDRGWIWMLAGALFGLTIG